MKAMIYAAGYGKRLHPLTERTPKALINVQNRPMLDWVITHLIHFGVNEIIINTHHLHKKVESFIQNSQYSAQIEISHEKKILGTGGGLYNTLNFWDDSSFFVCNADILCNANLAEFFSNHEQRENLVTLGVNNRVSNSMLLIDETSHLIGRRKNSEQLIIRQAKGRIREVGFCGFHMISPQIFSYFRSPIEFSIIDEYFKILKSGIRISTWHIEDAYWEDIGTFESLESANKRFPGYSYASS